MHTGAENVDGQHGWSMDLLMCGVGYDARHVVGALGIIKEISGLPFMEYTASVIQAMQIFALLMTCDECAFQIR